MADDINLQTTSKKGKKVFIIGAGLSGLVCGMRLARAGFEVNISEQLTYPGGQLSYNRIGREYLETNPHHLRRSDKALLALCRELGINDSIEWFDSFWHGRASRKKLGYFEGGFNTLISRLTNEITELGGTIGYSATVAEITRNPNYANSNDTANDHEPEFIVSCVLNNSSKMDFFADYVICATSCRNFINVSNSLPIGIDIRDQLMDIKYSAEISLMMVLKTKPSEVYFQKALSSLPFNRIVNHTTCFGERNYEGHVVYLVGDCSVSDSLWIESDAKIKDLYFDSYRKLFPSVTRNDIKAWRLKKNRYTYSTHFPVSSLISPIENCYICSSALRLESEVPPPSNKSASLTAKKPSPENRMDICVNIANKICNMIIESDKGVSINESKQE